MVEAIHHQPCCPSGLLFFEAVSRTIFLKVSTGGIFGLTGLPANPWNMADVNFALYGLGDSSYEKFCYAGKILARRMLSLGAQLLGSEDDDDDDRPQTEAIVKEMRQLGVTNNTDSNTMEDEEKQHGCLAWGDERAPDG